MRELPIKLEGLNLCFSFNLPIAEFVNRGQWTTVLIAHPKEFDHVVFTGGGLLVIPPIHRPAFEFAAECDREFEHLVTSQTALTRQQFPSTVTSLRLRLCGSRRRILLS